MSLELEGYIVAVKDLEPSAAFYERYFGITFGPKLEREQGNSVTRIGRHGSGMVQLMAARGEGAMQKYLDDRGEGLYAVVFRTDNIEQERDRFIADGLAPAGDIIDLPDVKELLLRPRQTFGAFTVIRQYK